MPEESKQTLKTVGVDVDKLDADEIQRLSDIAYGMLLVKQAQPKKEE
jgi:hypothetical protein